MKTIGFIDYYLSEWHADNYPTWIKEKTNGEYVVKYAYGHIEPPKELTDRVSNKEWAETQGVELLDTMEEVIEKSDYLIVLSPDNSEMHYELSKLALESGKPVYIDKTFADSKEEAERIFAIAKKSGSPCFSSSALRFSDKLKDVVSEDITTIIGTGNGNPAIYVIHQLEPILMLMGYNVDKVMFLDNPQTPSWVLHFDDGRTATMAMFKGSPVSLKICHGASEETIVVNDEFFLNLMGAIVEMFETGKQPIEHQETIKIMAIREVCVKAMDKPLTWFEVK